MLKIKEEEGFEVQKYALQFPESLENGFSYQEYIITLKRLFNRIGHPGKVDSTNLELVIEVFARISIKAWSKSDINKFQGQLENYKKLIPFKWFEKRQDFASILGTRENPSPIKIGIDNLIRFMNSRRKASREEIIGSLGIPLKDFIQIINESGINEKYDLTESIETIITELFN